MNAEPIVVEQTFRAPVEAVWKAITEKARMCQWFFDAIPAFEPVVGFETRFTVRVENVNYVHLWRLKEVVPQKRIVYEWRYAGIPGDSTVTWELLETTEGSKLSLTHAGHESFPRDNPVFSRESGQAGWSYFIRESLKKHVESRPDVQ